MRSLVNQIIFGGKNMKTLSKCLTLLMLTTLTVSACSLPSRTPAGDRPTEPSPVTPESTTAIPTESGEAQSILDACLIGVWTMDVVDLNNKFLDLTRSSSMLVVAPSSMSMEFRNDNSYLINGQTTIRFEIPNSTDYMEMDGAHEGNGAYGADGTLLTIVPVEYHVDYGAMRAYINGEQAEGEFGTPAIPEDALGPPAYASYRCTANSLEITYDGPLGSITELWAR